MRWPRQSIARFGGPMAENRTALPCGRDLNVSTAWEPDDVTHRLRPTPFSGGRSVQGHQGTGLVPPDPLVAPLGTEAGAEQRTTTPPEGHMMAESTCRTPPSRGGSACGVVPADSASPAATAGLPRLVAVRRCVRRDHPAGRRFRRIGGRVSPVTGGVSSLPRSNSGKSSAVRVRLMLATILADLDRAERRADDVTRVGAARSDVTTSGGSSPVLAEVGCITSSQGGPRPPDPTLATVKRCRSSNGSTGANAAGS